MSETSRWHPTLGYCTEDAARNYDAALWATLHGFHAAAGDGSSRADDFTASAPPKPADDPQDIAADPKPEDDIAVDDETAAAMVPTSSPRLPISSAACVRLKPMSLRAALSSLLSRTMSRSPNRCSIRSRHPCPYASRNSTP
jgi:hypothetical protein